MSQQNTARGKIIDSFWDVYWFIFLEELKKRETNYREILNQIRTRKTTRSLPTPHLDVRSIKVEIYQPDPYCLAMININKASFWPGTFIRGFPFLKNEIDPGLYIFALMTGGSRFICLETADSLSQQFAKIQLGHTKGGV